MKGGEQINTVIGVGGVSGCIEKEEKKERKTQGSQPQLAKVLY
jgi:hypothetical protein